MNLPVTPSAAWRGRITALHGNLLEGWAMNAADPHRRAVVAVHGDGRLFSLAQAEQFHPEAPGDGSYGFRLMLSDAQLEGARCLSLTLANHAEVLDSLSLPAQRPAQHTGATSRVQWQPGLVLRGWLVNAECPTHPLSVYAYEGERLLASATPTQWLNVHGRQVEAGFSLTLPLSLADGQPHTLVIEDSQGRELAGSPITLREWPQGLSHWLDQLAPALPKHTQALLCAQLERYERLLPRAVGLAFYGAWREAFPAEPAMPFAPRAAKGACLAILWLGGTPAKPPRSKTLTLHHVDLPDPDDATAYRNALAQACVAGEVVTQLHRDDTLAPQALELAYAALQQSDGQREHAADVLYSDFDAPPAGAGGPRRPALLPAWDPDRQWGQDIVGSGLCLVRAERLAQAEYPPSCPHDFSYAALESAGAFNSEAGAQRVRHLPQLLRQRAEPWPAVIHDEALAGRRARLQRQDPLAWLERHPQQPAVLRLQRRLDTWPDVTLIIPTRDALALLRRCIETILATTDYPGRVRLLVVDNDSRDPETLAWLVEQQARGERPLVAPAGQGGQLGRAVVDVLHWPHPFNYAAINNAAVAASDTEVIGLVNNDIEALHPEWLQRMVALLMREATGAVGAKLLWPNGMVQHGGVIGGQYGGLAGHVGNTWHTDDPGYLDMNHLTQRFSAVTAACLLLRRADYLAVGGLDERDFPVAFNDVDLCLKLRARGKAVVWTPEARLIHAESATRGKDESPEKAARAQREMDNLRRHWGNALDADPAYNPNLGLDTASAPYTSLALPPRPRKARSHQLLQ